MIWEFKRVGVKTVTVFTEEDHRSPHVELADDAICIGKTLKCYYTRWDRIISVAEICEVNAIHPGDGPLSIDERFREACAEIGVQFLGRNAEPGGFT